MFGHKFQHKRYQLKEIGRCNDTKCKRSTMNLQATRNTKLLKINYQREFQFKKTQMIN